MMLGAQSNLKFKPPPQLQTETQTKVMARVVLKGRHPKANLKNPVSIRVAKILNPQT